MNRFPLGPDWTWQARMAVFPKEDALDDYLALAQAEYDRRARHYADRGVTFVNATINFHARFDWIDRFDDVAEVTRRIAAACHRADMRVYEHHSSNLTPKAGAMRYHNWNPADALAVDIRTGLPTGQYGKTNACFLCINNAQYKEHYDQYVLDFIERTGVDGLMYDDVHYAGQYYCGCPDCRRGFEAFAGYRMPEPDEFPLDDYSSPVWRDWIRFRLDLTAGRMRELRQKLPRDFALFSCMTGGVLTDGDVHHAGASVETFCTGTNCIFTEGGNLSWRNRGAHRPRNFYANWEKMAVEKKYTQAISDSFCQPALDMHYPADPKEGFFCWALTKLYGHGLWRCDTNLYGGHNYDDEFEEWEPEFDYFNWEARHADLFRFPKNGSDIAVVFSQRTKLHLGLDPQQHGEAWAGWVQALGAAGLMVDGLLDRDIERPDRLARYRLVILPNVACMTASAVANLRTYVDRGGTLVATHKTSLYDETGGRLADFALGDLFGCHFWRERPEEKVSWFADRRFAAEPLFSDVPPRLSSFPGLMVVGQAETADRKIIAWTEKTPMYHDEPQAPAMVRSRLGKGTVIYVAPKVGALAYRQGLFPIWHEQYHKQQQIDKDDQGRPMVWWDAPGDRNGAKWYFVDEGSDAYRCLARNLVEGLVPNPRIRLQTPVGLVFNAFLLSESPADYSGAGPLVVGLLNTAGAQFTDGQEIAPPSRLHYPKLAGTAQILLTGVGVADAVLHSPDLATPVPLAVEQLGSTARVCLDLQHLRRVGFVRIGRTPQESAG